VSDDAVRIINEPEGARGGREPVQTWQKVAVVLIIAAVAATLYLMFRAGAFTVARPQTRDHVRETEHATSFIAPPDVKEAAAHVTATPPTRPTPNHAASTEQKGVDESAEFNAPVGDGNGGGGGGAQPVYRRGASGQEAGGAGVPVMAQQSQSSLLLPPAKAYRLPHPLYTVAEGTQMPCAEVTAIDTGSGGPVLVKAVLQQDVWSMYHEMVLLNKGTKILGEVGHGLVNGLDRIAVVWREATLPAPYGIRVSLDSPAAEPLGEGGLEGQVKRHEWDKIKGVMAVSLLQGALNIAQAAVSPAGGTSINFGSLTSGTESAGNILLQSKINIPDTFHRDQGLACSVFLARDLDFSNVFSLAVDP
jgi:type IV secretion system protein VirB10